MPVSFEGLDRLVDAVRKAPEAVYEVLDVRVLEGAEIVQVRAQGNHRFVGKSGQLERSVTVREVGRAQAVVFLDRNVAFYGPYVHEGTRAHRIAPVKRKMLRFVSRGGSFVFRREVFHPGTKPDKFLYQAAQETQKEVHTHLQEGIWDAIKEAGLA
jgi:hypothetical protein